MYTQRSGEMAALILYLRKKTPKIVREGGSTEVLSSNERDDILDAALRGDPGGETDSVLPVGQSVSPDSLLGKMPKEDSIIKKENLQKLSSSREWKPMQVCLTSAGIFLSRPGDELLRDLIPLDEIVEVKKSNCAPHKAYSNNSEKGVSVPGNGRHSSLVNLKISTLIQEEDEVSQSKKHILQIRTVENGYNSGRMYYLAAESDECCQSWIQSIRSASDHAIMMKLAGPSFLKRAQYRLAQFYHSTPVQGVVAVLIFFSFLCNILQTELIADDDNSQSDASPQAIFSVLESFFTFAFAVELLINILSHFLLPFLEV